MSVKRERQGDGMSKAEWDLHMVETGQAWPDEAAASRKLHKVADILQEAIAHYDEIERWREFDAMRSKAHLDALYDKFHEMMGALENKK